MKMTPTKALEPVDSPLPGIYRHYKGSLYQVMGMARHSESEEWLVVYQALYAERGFWLRPLSLWLEPVTGGGGEQTEPASDPTERFTLLETNNRSLQAVMEPG